MLLKFNFLQISKTTSRLSVSEQYLMGRCLPSLRLNHSFHYHHTLLVAGFGNKQTFLFLGKDRGVYPVKVPQRELELQ